jgi:hypothetical protein
MEQARQITELGLWWDFVLIEQMSVEQNGKGEQEYTD